MPDQGAWALKQLSSFVVAVSAVTDPWRAIAVATERAAEAVNAEVVAVLCADGTICKSRVFDDAVLMDVVDRAGAGESGVATLRGGECAAWVDLDGDLLDALVVVRPCDHPFADDEIGVLQAIGRALVLSVRLLSSLDGERALQDERAEQEQENADLTDELAQRQDLIDRLLDIQRAVSRRVPLQEVLDRITSSTADLLQADFVALRLTEGTALEKLRLVSAGGLDRDLVAVAKRSLVEAGIAAHAMRECRLIVRHNYADDNDAIPHLVDVGVRFAMAAPVYVDNCPVGCLSVVSRNRGLGYGPDGQQVLMALAEQASLALTGAQTRDRMNKASRDPLTGLPNRTLFLDRLEHALARDERAAATDIGVLFIDLDRFKYVNDSLGHAVGDELLALLAKRVEECLRDSDTAARLGGDEIAVLLEGVSLLQARETAERLLAALREPVLLRGREIVTSASIGIAHTADATADAGDLLRNADVAMYRAKHVGGDQVRVYEPGLHAAVLLRLELEGDLRRALRDHEFRLVYQPVVELATQRIVGVEALLRWDHPDRGAVPPESFIPVAEESGLIVEIGRWVLQTACREAARWPDLMPDVPTYLSVNISARQLQRAKLVDDVTGALRAAGLPSERLLLELTETALMQDPQTAAETLRQLKRMGVGIVLDDFGTGYSSLNYLREFPVDVMKIDRSFISGIAADQQALATTMISLARDLDLSTVAEGIETPGQLAHLLHVGCVYGQGYLFSRPLPPEHLTAVLRQGTFAVPVAVVDPA